MLLAGYRSFESYFGRFYLWSLERGLSTVYDSVLTLGLSAVGIAETSAIFIFQSAYVPVLCLYRRLLYFMHRR